MILSIKGYKDKRKELVDAINECYILANEAAMTNNWMEYSQLNKRLLYLRGELSKLDGRTAHE